MTSYLVAAATGFRGHQEGEEIQADPDDPAVQRALARGSLKPTKTKNKKTEEVEDDA